jgi:N-acetylmuramoyl-L-alanine amidase
MRRIFLVIVSLFIALSVWAAPYDELRAKYFKLRNTDPDVLKVEEWTNTSSELLKVRGKGRSEAELFALISYGELFRVYRLPSYYKSAEALFSKLAKAKDFSERDNRDDVLKEWQRILNDKGNKSEAARIGRLISAAPVAQPVAATPTTKKTKLVILDPGHGGEDHGAKGPGINEKMVVLDVALKAEEALRRYSDISVRLTRRDDRFVPLQERTNLANDYTAAAFVSLHTNASPDSKAEGVETYVLDNSGDEATKSLAERENSVLELEGAADLQFILSDLIQTSKAPDSFALAAAVQESLVSMIGKRYQAPRNLGVRKAPFYVLVGAHMPCILVELSFIDHEREGELLASRRYREVLGESVARGIAKYFGFEE